MPTLDEKMMRRVLALASLGVGTTSPNPLVGAVVARGPRVLGQGFHHRAGEPHAEVLALREAGAASRGATLYTNLEPCCHTGRTPPCFEEIVRSGVRRVVASIRDPDPRVNGGGFRRLRSGGVRVEVGLLGAEAARLNLAFTKFVRDGLPFVTLKTAASLDGKTAAAGGDSKWITSAEAREHARLLRREHDAVMVGLGTVRADDPRLTARPRRWRPRPLLRVVMDTRLRIPAGARLVETATDSPVVIFCGSSAPEAKAKRLRRRGVEVIRVPLSGRRVDLKRALQALSRQHAVTRLLVEGGAELHASFVARRLADRMVAYLAPKLLGGAQSRGMIAGRGPALVRLAVPLDGLRTYRVGAEVVLEADFRA